MTINKTGNPAYCEYANKAIKQIQETEKTLRKLSKLLTESELDMLCDAHTNLDISSKRIAKIRGYF